ncbi:MAG TPA: hypothetical protein VF623_10320 [Segetibacter sp.]|jgi:hypothetical protein
MISFFLKIVDVLNELSIPYMLSGSVAMSIYIIPRATRNFDFVVYMHQKQVANFVQQFKEGYYCDEDSIKDAIKHKSMFNIIDQGSEYKADFILLKEDEYGIEAFNRRIEMDYFGKLFFLVTAEDLIIAKIIWIQQSKSALQIEDIKKLCELKTLDWTYINRWTKKMRLNTFNLFSND